MPSQAEKILQVSAPTTGTSTQKKLNLIANHAFNFQHIRISYLLHQYARNDKTCRPNQDRILKPLTKCTELSDWISSILLFTGG